MWDKGIKVRKYRKSNPKIQVFAGPYIFPRDGGGREGVRLFVGWSSSP